MNKIEQCWVIQRDDGKFMMSRPYEIARFSSKIAYSEFCLEKQSAEDFIRRFNLQNCRPVKVKIEVVGEDE